MKRSRFSLRFLVIAAVTTVLGSGTVYADLPKVRVFTGSTAHWADLVVGMDKGYFQKHGIEVEPTYFTTGAAATESFVAGKGDIVLTCELASLGMWKRGAAVGVSRQARLIDQEYLVAREGIESPKDLEGKKIATRFGSTVEYFLRKYIQVEGIDPEKVEIINLEPADMVVALDSGDIDAYSNYIPFPQLSLLATKGAKVLATSGDYITENCLYSATQSFVNDHQDRLVAFLAGIQEAGAYVSENLDETSEIVAREFRGKPETMKIVVENMEFAIGYDEEFRNNMQAVADFFEFGPVQWDDWFDSRALKQVAPDSVED
jgi:ABC-type nitrate/sulfonate/bicarbonate transport system substrate-binding protein